MQRCVAKDVFVIPGAQKDMRLPGVKGNMRALRKAVRYIDMACQGDMRREWPRIRRKIRFTQCTDQPLMQRLQLWLALHAQNQNAVFLFSKVRKAVQRQARRRKIRRAARQHIACILEPLLGHIAKERQRDMVILAKRVAS